LSCKTRLAGSRIAWPMPSASRNSYTSGLGKGCVAAETKALHPAPVVGNHRLQHRPPALDRMDVSGPPGAPLQIAELVEVKHRVIAGAAEMAVVGAAFLVAVGRAFARIHVQHDDPRLTPLVHRLDPLARQIGAGSEVLRPRQPLGLETSHLAGRGTPTHRRVAADHPAHRWIAAQPLGVVRVLVAGQPAEYRLPQQPDQRVASIPAGACHPCRPALFSA
jgi:hypothetical protein